MPESESVQISINYGDSRMVWNVLLDHPRAAFGFVAIHLFIGDMRFLDRIPRSRWLSFASGSSVAFIFVYVLPNYGRYEQAFDRSYPEATYFWVAIYLAAMMGLITFYGVERVVRSSPEVLRRTDPHRITRPFLIQISFFSIFTFLIAYIMTTRISNGALSLLLFSVALGLHFTVVDFGMHKRTPWLYDHWGRWILSGAVAAGWLIGSLASISQILLGILVAFISGGVILNTLKEELPEREESRFIPFLIGAVGYAILLVLL